MTYRRPIPLDPPVNFETEPFWRFAEEGRLMLKRCGSCRKTHYYPRGHCPFCLSDDTEWHEAQGTGEVYSFSVMRRTDIPYAIAFVTLSEGITMMSHIVDCPFEAIAIGMPVRLVFVTSEGGQAVPVFRPDNG